MAKIFVGLLVVFVLLANSSLVAGSQQDQTEFKMPCAEVLKLGLDKFVDVYGEKTQDYSTYGQKQAYGYYVDCKRPANDQKASGLSELRSKQVDAVRDGLNEIGDASWTNAYILAGGGTLYGLASVSAYAVREDVIASLITSISLPKDGRARRRANAAVRRAKRNLPGAISLAELESWDVASRPEHLKAYRANVDKIRKSFTDLEAIIRLLPDHSADLIAHRMEDEIKAGFEE